MSNLFQKYRFKMHSGGMSDFKLECDALTRADYETLAYLVSTKITFKTCYGIPKGGLLFAECLNQYADETQNTLLIADDVLTTGNSFETFKQELLQKGADESQIKGVTVFTRGLLLPYVTVIFSLNPEFWQND